MRCIHLQCVYMYNVYTSTMCIDVQCVYMYDMFTCIHYMYTCIYDMYTCIRIHVNLHI